MHNETNHKSSHRIAHGIDRLATVYYSGVRAEWDRCRVESLRSKQEAAEKEQRLEVSVVWAAFARRNAPEIMHRIFGCTVVFW